MMRRSIPPLLTVALLATAPAEAAGQAVGAAGDSTVVTAGPRYTAGGLWRLFWGDHYREAWTTPLRVPVLDLDEFAGGLKPLRRGSGRQTKLLELEGADRRRYFFRSVDKDPTGALPVVWRATIAAEILQDQISSQHPASELVADRLEEAADLLHVERRLFVMPDDPRLGEFREEFAGMLGLMVERVGGHLDESAIFAGVSRVADSDDVVTLIQASPADRIDSRAFLTARLVDLLIGDWDRHRHQWLWARVEGSDWLPIPLDRDQAFSKLDGLFPSQAWRFIPELVGFKGKFPSMIGLHFTAQEVDRRFLVDLERSAWDSVAASLSERITDDVIAEAVRRLPPELYAIDGPAIEAALRRRRDALPAAATRLYDLLAREVEIQATDAAEQLLISEIEERYVEVTIAERSAPDRPYFRRRFDPRETDELRIRLHGGDDLAIVRGSGKLRIAVRVIGGPGDDELRYARSVDGIHFYDQFGANRVTGNAEGRSGINSRSYSEWAYGPGQERPPRQWGGAILPILRMGLSSDYGFLIGAGATYYDYGFRRHPYAYRLSLSGGVASKGKLDGRAEADFRFENSRFHLTFATFYSELDVLHFFDFGNDTEKDSTTEFFEVERGVFGFEPAIVWSLDSKVDAALGGTVRYSNTQEDPEKFLGTLSPAPVGVGDFWQAGGFARLRVDTRDVGAAASRGATLSLTGRVYPEVLDVERTFGTLDAVATTYVTAPIVLQPTLALRAGGRKVWGNFPYFESAFLGGRGSLRGWDAERFAGDASLYGSAELRLLLGAVRLLLPGDLGVFGIADAGRVYLDGESPGGWHAGYGGGFWFSFLGRQNTLSASVVTGDEETAVYINYGFEY